MELGPGTFSCSGSVWGISLSHAHSSCVLLRETSFSPLSSRNAFQASAARTRSKLSFLEGKHRTIISKIRKPIEDENDQGMEEALDEQEEQSSFNSSSSLLSLTGKPDRSLSLLDDYELEELDSDHSSSLSHRSG